MFTAYEQTSEMRILWDFPNVILRGDGVFLDNTTRLPTEFWYILFLLFAVPLPIPFPLQGTPSPLTSWAKYYLHTKAPVRNL